MPLGVFEPVIVEKYCTEYLKLIHQYQNYKRNSIFLKYFKINKSESIIDDKLKSSYKRFDGEQGIIYDLYELTPAFYTSQVVNDIGIGHSGPQFLANMSIITYTIEKPNIDDIIVIDKAPFNYNNEIWRVISIRSAINLMRSSIPLHWYELTLEYAPIKNLDSLKINNYFVYLVTEEKYIPADLYVKFLNEYEKVYNALRNLQEISFNSYLELYSYNGYFPLSENRRLYQYLNQTNYFPEIKKPFGILKYNNNNQALQITNNLSLSHQLVDNYSIYNTDHITSISDFNDEINLFSSLKLLQLFMERLNAVRRS